jgi:hypothetical protein
MAAEQGAFGFDVGGPDNARLLEMDADFTPTGVVLQYLIDLRERHRLNPSSILDGAAGPGVFGRCARYVWPDAVIVGVELRGEEATHLGEMLDQGVYNALHVGVDFREYAQSVVGVERFDLAVTNPPFTLWREYVELTRPLLNDHGLLSLLGLNGWGQRSTDGSVFFEQCSPDRQSRICGSIGFRGDRTNPKTGKLYGTDTRDYSWWSWMGEELDGGGWITENLPRLESPLRRWKGRRPGEETPDEFAAIVAQVEQAQPAATNVRSRVLQLAKGMTREELDDQVLAVIVEGSGQGMARREIAGKVDCTASELRGSIERLKNRQQIVQQGERRAARYHAKGKRNRR